MNTHPHPPRSTDRPTDRRRCVCVSPCVCGAWPFWSGLTAGRKRWRRRAQPYVCGRARRSVCRVVSASSSPDGPSGLDRRDRNAPQEKNGRAASAQRGPARARACAPGGPRGGGGAAAFAAGSCQPVPGVGPGSATRTPSLVPGCAFSSCSAASFPLAAPPHAPPPRSLRRRAVAQRMARARRRIVPPRPPGGPTAHRRWLGPGALGWRSPALAPRPLHLTPALPRAIAARPCFMPRPKTGRSIETYPCSRSPSPAGHAGWVWVPASATRRLWTHGTVTRQSTPLPRRALCT